jgi:hypothetical protein
VRVRCEVWTRLPARETLARSLESGASRQCGRRLGDEVSVVLFCVDNLRIRVMRRVALGLKRCGVR